MHPRCSRLAIPSSDSLQYEEPLTAADWSRKNFLRVLLSGHADRELRLPQFALLGDSSPTSNLQQQEAPSQPQPATSVSASADPPLPSEFHRIPGSMGCKS